MAISVFDLFRIGIGPSSSHTVGPMRAARDFALALGDTTITRLVVRLHGSLAATGVGHGTDQAVIMGLMGEAPESIDPDTIASRLKQLDEGEPLLLVNGQPIAFEVGSDVEWDETCLPKRIKANWARTARRWHIPSIRRPSCSRYVSSISCALAN